MYTDYLIKSLSGSKILIKRECFINYNQHGVYGYIFTRYVLYAKTSVIKTSRDVIDS